MVLRPKISAILSLASLFFASTIGASGLSASDWREDLHFLAEQLPKVHVNAFHSISREEWMKRVGALDRAIPGMSTNEIRVGLMGLAAAIGDGHTSLSPFYLPQLAFHAVPLRFYAFSDGIFVRAADAEHRDLVGGRLRRVGGLKVEEAFERVASIVTRDNDQGLKLVVPLDFGIAEVLDGLGIIRGDKQISYELEKDGRIFTAVLPATIPLLEAAHAGVSTWMNPPGWIDARDDAGAPVPLWLKNPADLYWMEYLATSKTLYVQYNEVENKPGQSIAAFFDRVFRFARDHPVERIVLDIRCNLGGNGYYNAPIIRGLLRSGLDARGKLFVVIGRSTFSAAQLLINDLDRYTAPTYVGEPTGSRPTSYGDHDPIELPHSGLVMMASTVLHIARGKADPRKWTAPDLPAPLSFERYRKNVDPAIEAIERYRSIAQALGPSIAAGSPGAVESAYRAFKADPSTATIPTEREVNALGYDLMSGGLVPLATTVLRLNAESYPASANAHDSLGEAYLEVGEFELARAEYRRVLALAPDNENALRMLREVDEREKRVPGRQARFFAIIGPR